MGATSRAQANIVKFFIGFGDFYPLEQPEKEISLVSLTHDSQQIEMTTRI